MPETTEAPNFVRDIIRDDVAAGKNGGRVHTRFPPEPNGYLHIGHAKAICLDFGMAAEFGGKCNLRFDDTNPVAEDVEYVDSIMEDIHWLGFDWEDRLFYASDYFERLYELAVQLIEKGLAYVDHQTLEEIREGRGKFKIPGKNSPYRDRTVAENLDLFARMRAGEFREGECVLRAKIDMASPNMNLRDPIMYRVLHAHHHRTGDAWCIYPMYDWAHGQSDALEGITHSLCTLEFDVHRPLYDWFVANLDGLPSVPRQIEFARLNLSYTVMSKRKLRQLVEEELVDGWDDPRMPTLVGLRRRGFTAEAIRAFADRVGVAKRNGVVDVALLEHAVKEHLNETAPRLMGVLDPLEVVIDNWEEGRVEWFEAPLHPTRPELGSRRIPFTGRLYVERDDFREEAPRKWHRLAQGKEVRLRYAALITCKEVERNEAGEVVRLICEWDPDSLGGTPADGRKVRGTLHWVSAEHALDAEVRVYDRLFRAEDPLSIEDWKSNINPESKSTRAAKLEPHLGTLSPEDRVQFERLGYFVADRHDYSSDGLVFNRTLPLRDSWAAIARAQAREAEARRQAEAKKKKAEEKARQRAAQKKKAKPLPEGIISFDDFVKVKLVVGRVAEVGPVEGADKLLRFSVDVGEDAPRQVFAGVAMIYPDPSVLLGKLVLVVANLAPRKMRFGMSEAMLLAAGGGTERLALVTVQGFEPGDKLS